MHSGFLEKLVQRLDRLGPENLQAQFLRLVQEKGLLETVFQAIQEGVIVVDGAGKLSYANKAAEQVLGFEAESSAGRAMSAILRGIDWDRILELDTGEWSKLVNTELEVMYPQHRWLNVYLVPIPAPPPGEKAVVVILRDVTRDREHEASRVESERLNAVKLLAAGVAHEIGNPLNALHIHLQLLDRELRDLGRDRESGSRDSRGKKGDPAEAVAALRELVSVARSEVSRLDIIVAQFLRALRPAKPNLVLQPVEKIVEETLTLLRQEIQNRRIAVKIERPETLPQVPVDRDQMKQAFFNVIRNAFQAMPDGGRLGIVLSSSDEHLSVSFRDSGVGIRREDFGHIFDPYFTTKAEGTGLGLMIVQRIVQDHGGQIEVVSKPEAGTSFTILLPLADRRVRLLKPYRTAGRGRRAGVGRVAGSETDRT